MSVEEYSVVNILGLKICGWGMSVALTLACLGFFRANWADEEWNFRRAQEVRVVVRKKLQRRHGDGRARLMVDGSWLLAALSCGEMLDSVR